MKHRQVAASLLLLIRSALRKRGEHFLKDYAEIPRYKSTTSRGRILSLRTFNYIDQRSP